MDKRPIGVFDSGIGGLTVLYEILKQLPNEDIIYFGDTARVPYGTRTVETIRRYSEQSSKFLLKNDIKALVVACNTVSAIALKDLKGKLDISVFGVIEPGSHAAVKATENRKIGIIGTPATIKSGAYEKKISFLMKDVNIKSKACPLFVPLVEEGWIDNEVARLTAKEYLREIFEFNVDTLVLGCTHYPALMSVIEELSGKNVKLINPAYETAVSVKNYLTDKDMLNEKKEAGKTEFYVSDNPDKFSKVGEWLLKKPIENVVKIDL